MWDCLVKPYQDYQDGIDFPGRALFGLAAHLAAVGYGVGYRLRRQFMARESRRAVRPRARVFAVGSLTVGGSGKTSLVDYIASRLLQSGRRVVILTRGYGRRSRQRGIIEPGTAHTHDVDSVGDEPLLLARRRPETTIIIDTDRAGAARDYERENAAEVFLLDDSYQYHRIAYDRRILTMVADDLQSAVRLFPAGRWREPPSEISRADAVVVVGARGERSEVDVESQLTRHGFHGPMFHFAYECAGWRNPDGSAAELEMCLERSRCGAFCGLGRPERFFQWLSSTGMALVCRRRFGDHYRYRQQDVDRLCAEAQDDGLDFLITTEKDAVKLARFACRGVRIIYPDVRLAPLTDAEAFDRFLTDGLGCGTRD